MLSSWYAVRIIQSTLIQIIAECPTKDAAQAQIDQEKEAVNVGRVQHTYKLWQDRSGSSIDSIRRNIVAGAGA